MYRDRFNDYNKNCLVNGKNYIGKKATNQIKKECNSKSINNNINYKKYPSQKYRYKRYKLKSKCEFKKRRRTSNDCYSNAYVCNKSKCLNKKNNNNECCSYKKRRKGCGRFSPLWWLLFFLII